MDKIRWCSLIIFTALLGACNTKPDFSAEVKTIDSLETEVKKSMDECKKMDTTWVIPITNKASNLTKLVTKVYAPDSIIPDEIGLITYYKGYRKVGKRFIKGREKLMEGFELSLKQLNDLKTDAENGSIKKEDLAKYLLEEKNVTTELIYEFNDLKYSTLEVVGKFDSLTPLIEKIVEVYSPIYEEKKNKQEGKFGTTIH